MPNIYEIGNGENEELKWRITFKEGAFDVNDASTRLGSKKCALTEEIRQIEGDVEILDRYDRFDKRLIPDSAYSRTLYLTDDGKQVEYGISYNPEIHGSEEIINGVTVRPVILEHQKTSTDRFLKNHRGFGMLADIVGSGKTYESGIVLSELAKRGIVTSLLLVVPDVVYESWIKVMEHDFGLGKIVKGSKYDDPTMWIESDEKFNKSEAVAGDSTPIILHPVGNRLNAEDFEKRDGYYQPKYPMIVKSSDFIEWKETALKDILFSVVVVDEAHRLCDENEAQNKRAMYLLSLIMQTKRKANLMYCLLLSATPHSGNLEDMFRLWYFIRLKGGDPNDFKEGTPPTSQYNEEKEYYLNDICHGAKTVMDFVIKEEIGIIRGGRALFMKSLRKWLEKEAQLDVLLQPYSLNKTVQTYNELIGKEADAVKKLQLRREFADYIMSTSVLRKAVLEAFFALEENKENHLVNYKTSLMIYMYRFWQDNEDATLKKYRDKFDAYLKTINLDNKFDYLHEGRKYAVINDFFEIGVDNAEKLEINAIHNYVTKRVAYAYHYRILHTIMERQPQKKIKKVSKKKTVVNFMFANIPTDNAKSRAIDMKLLGRDVILHYSSDDLDFLNNPKAVEIKSSGKRQSFSEFVKNSSGDYGVNYSHALLKEILPAFGFNTADTVMPDEPTNAFNRMNSLTFYQKQLSHMRTDDPDAEVRYSVVPVGRADTIFQAKIAKLKQIAAAHGGERVIVFFDYSIDDEKRKEDPLKGYTIEDVYKQLKDEFADRVLDLANEGNRKEVKEAFDDDAHSDAILVATDYKFTEGANFQKCCVIVNFEVTPNPIGIQQSIGRVFRYGQKNDVTIYSLADIRDLEGYVLAYFTRIDLMSDKNGEAEILAGCNNDNMVTIRCPSCGRLLYLSMDDYEAMKGDPHSEAYCDCDGHSHLKTPVGAQEYVCDNSGGSNPCKAHLYKKGDQYICYGFGHSDEGVLEKNANENEYHCPKLCLIKHCTRFTMGDLQDCPALKAVRERPNVSGVQLQYICVKCELRKSNKCPEECRLTSDSLSCHSEKSCKHRHRIVCQYAPQRIKFNDNMEAPCPYCNHGTLRPVKSKTFENFIREAYGQRVKTKLDDRFTENFMAEIDKVVLVYEVLNSDNIMDENN